MKASFAEERALSEDLELKFRKSQEHKEALRKKFESIRKRLDTVENTLGYYTAK
jgi:hypothetical protein